MSKKQIKLSLPAHLNFSGAIRRFSNSVFKEIGFAEEWCSRLELVVDELFMNAVMYGSSSDSLLYIMIDFDGVEVSVAVHDEGKGEKKLSPEDLKNIVKQNGANHQVTKTSGRGLAMIANQWTDQFDILQSEHGGMAISFHKKVDSQPPPAMAPEKNAMNFSLLDDPKPSQGTPVKQSSTPLFANQAGTSSEGMAINVQDGTSLSAIEALAGQVKQKVDTLSSGSTLVLDFGQTDYINSTFIGYLASWYNDLQTKGSKLILKNVNQAIKDVLHLVGLNQIFSLDH